MTVYTANIPQAADNPSDSQSLILQNFQSIGTAFQLNHVELTDTTDRGKHTRTDWVRQSPDPTSNANEGLVFAKLISGATELFYGKDTGTNAQWTSVQPSTGGGSGTSYSWNFVDGLSIRTGTVTHSGTSTGITFDTPFANQVFTAFLTPIGGAALISGWNVQGLVLGGFTLASTGSGSGQSFFYLALGR